MPSMDHKRFDSDTGGHDGTIDTIDANTVGGVMSTRRHLSTAPAGRRWFLGLGAAAVAVGLAGCAETVGNLLAELILADVTLLN